MCTALCRLLGCLAFSGDQDWDRDWDHDQDRDRDWEQDRRGRSRELASRDCWPSTRSPRSSKWWLLLPSAACLWKCLAPFLHDAVLFPGLPQRSLALPPMEKTTLAMEREHQHRASMMDYESRCQVCLGFLFVERPASFHGRDGLPFPRGRVPPPPGSHLAALPARSPRLSPVVTGGQGNCCLFSDAPTQRNSLLLSICVTR